MISFHFYWQMADCSAIRGTSRSRPQLAGWTLSPARGWSSSGSCVKVMKFVFKKRNCVSKMMNFILYWWILQGAAEYWLVCCAQDAGQFSVFNGRILIYHSTIPISCWKISTFIIKTEACWEPRQRTGSPTGTFLYIDMTEDSSIENQDSSVEKWLFLGRPGLCRGWHEQRWSARPRWALVPALYIHAGAW